MKKKSAGDGGEGARGAAMEGGGWWQGGDGDGK